MIYRSSSYSQKKNVGLVNQKCSLSKNGEDLNIVITE